MSQLRFAACRLNVEVGSMTVLLLDLRVVAELIAQRGGDENPSQQAQAEGSDAGK